MIGYSELMGREVGENLNDYLTLLLGPLLWLSILRQFWRNHWMGYCWGSGPFLFFGLDLSWRPEASVKFERYSRPVSWLEKKFSAPRSILPVSHSAPVSYSQMDSPPDSTIRPTLVPPNSTCPAETSQSASAPLAALCSASPPSPRMFSPIWSSPVLKLVPLWVYQSHSPAPNWSQWVSWPGVALSAAPSATHRSDLWWPPTMTVFYELPPSC